MNTRSKGFTRLRAGAAGLCLLAYLQTVGVGSVLLGWAATAEGSHAVSLDCAPDHVSVVLHHGRDSEQNRNQHWHGVASRIVCLLGKSGPTPQADHVASFTSNAACECPASQTKAAEIESSGSVNGYPSHELILPLPSFAPADLILSASDSSASLRALRTTVLLI